MSNWERRQRAYDYRSQRMMQGYPGRLSEAVSCAGCVLKLAFFCFLIIALLAAALFIYIHFFVHVR